MSHNKYRYHKKGKRDLSTDGQNNAVENSKSETVGTENLSGAAEKIESQASGTGKLSRVQENGESQTSGTEENSGAGYSRLSKNTEPKEQTSSQDAQAENSYEDEDDEEYFSNEVQYGEPDNKPNPIITKLKDIRMALTVDFEKPLKVSDQLIIMGVILTISILLFFILYFAASLIQHKDGDESSAVLTEETGEVPADEKNNTASQQSKDISEKESKPSEKKEKSEPKKTSSSQKEVSYDIEMESIYINNDKIHYGYQVLVNKECQCFYEGENIESLINTRSSSYDITDESVGLDENIIDNVNEMLDDFTNIYGNSDIMMACGYRSYELQVNLYNNEVDTYGEELADLWVAPPGFSEHQTGFAFDLDLNDGAGISGIHYDGIGDYSWINENCYKYGFIVRYPKGKVDITGIEYEPWHFRYVGPAAAYYISKKEMTLEEYIDIVHTYSPEKPLYITGDDDKKWCVYYIEESGYDDTELTVPKNLKYEISGDNYSGYIITVELE